MFLSAYYCWTYLLFVAPANRKAAWQQVFVALGFLFCLAVYAAVARTTGGGLAARTTLGVESVRGDSSGGGSGAEKARVTVGQVAVGVNIVMYAAPLSTLRTVIQTWNADSIPADMVLASSACSTLWFMYGYLVGDSFVAFPNVLGMLLGVVQIVIILVIGKTTKDVLPQHVVE